MKMKKGQTVTMVIQMDDTPGLLAELLREAAKYRANILTIHQSIPINGIATLTLSIEIFIDNRKYIGDGGRDRRK